MAAKYFSHARQEMLGFVPESSRDVLEIGCSEGRFGETLQKRIGCRVTGVEINADAYSVAKNRLHRAYNATAESFLEAHNECYDAICFNDVLEHMADPWTQLRRCRRLLRNNGCLVASIPNIYFFDSLRDILIRQDFPYQDAGIFDRTHLRFFTRKSIGRMLLDCGYEPFRCEGINGLTSRRYTWINRLTFRRFEDALFPQFAVVARPAKNP